MKINDNFNKLGIPKRTTTANNTYKKSAVQSLSQALWFVSSAVAVISFRLRNRQLLVAAKLSAQCYDNTTDNI